MTLRLAMLTVHWVIPTPSALQCVIASNWVLTSNNVICSCKLLDVVSTRSFGHCLPHLLPRLCSCQGP
jgi:hypothetical protein